MDQLLGMISFVKVVDSSGFCAAARQLGVSGSVVSARIKTLEDRLGVRLLNRNTRSVKLTDIGRQYYESCRQILFAVEQADYIAEAGREKPAGVLRLNVSPGIPGIIADPIAEFAALYPEASLRVIETGKQVDLVEHNFDVAVRIGPASDCALILRRYGNFRMVVCGTPGYFAFHGCPKHPLDLTQHNCLRSYDCILGDEWLFCGPLGEHRIRPTGNLESNGIDALRWAAKIGLGLICVPAPFVRAELDSGELVPVLTEFMAGTFSIDALYSDRRYISPKLSSFLELLAKHFRGKRWRNALDSPRLARCAEEQTQVA